MLNYTNENLADLSNLSTANNMHPLKIVHNINIDEITESPFQPRKYFDKQQIQELAISIANHGLLQPISVRKVGTYYELIAGERRLRACEFLGFERIPAIIVELDDKQTSIVAIIENIQRENLNFLEEANGYAKLIDRYKLTQEEVAKSVGKDQSTIANKLRLLKLSPNVQKILIENNLTERHARALLKINNEILQIEVLKQIVKDKMNVNQTENFIKSNATTQEKTDKYKFFIKDIRLFTNSIKQTVDLMNNSGINTNYEIKEKNNGYSIVIDVLL